MFAHVRVAYIYTKVLVRRGVLGPSTCLRTCSPQVPAGRSKWLFGPALVLPVHSKRLFGLLESDSVPPVCSKLPLRPAPVLPVRCVMRRSSSFLLAFHFFSAACISSTEGSRPYWARSCESEPSSSVSPSRKASTRSNGRILTSFRFIWVHFGRFR